MLFDFRMLTPLKLAFLFFLKIINNVFYKRWFRLSTYQNSYFKVASVNLAIVHLLDTMNTALSPTNGAKWVLNLFIQGRPFGGTIRFVKISRP